MHNTNSRGKPLTSFSALANCRSISILCIASLRSIILSWNCARIRLSIRMSLHLPPYLAHGFVIVGFKRVILIN